jgi:hypothetical protein
MARANALANAWKHTPPALKAYRKGIIWPVKGKVKKLSQTSAMAQRLQWTLCT